MSARFDILLVGQTPPPYHGQAVVTEMLFTHDWGDIKVARLRMAYSDRIDAVGKFAPGKILHLLSLILKTWWIALTKNPEVLYYLPASANRAPVIRDIVYLTAVRGCFSKTVFHYHAAGLPEYLNGSGLFGKLGSLVYANADVSIEICETKHSPGREFNAHHTVIIPNGVDAVVCERAPSYNDKFVVLFMGALNEGKGLIDVIRAAEILGEKRSDVVFLIAGSWASQNFKQEVMARINNAGLNEDFVFLGVLRGEDKWQAYANADLFLFPSHYQSENFPMVLIEAMASSVPAITTNWRGIPQLVGDSEAAILCDINAPEQYAITMDMILNNKQRLDEMGHAARARYEACYTRERFICSMEKVFRDALAS